MGRGRGRGSGGSQWGEGKKWKGFVGVEEP